VNSQTNREAVLALADGTIFRGLAIGASGLSVGEVVFNTALTGYQEILTDPSYARQIVTLTYPHIGNVGTNIDDEESDSIWSAGLVIRDLPLLASNFRSECRLDDYLKRHNILGIADVDTRKLTRLLRRTGAQSGCIMAGDIDIDKAINAAREFCGLKGLDLAKEVTTSAIYSWSEHSWDLNEGHRSQIPSDNKYKVVAYDFGVKKNILRMLVDRNCELQVVPAQTSGEDVLAMQPDGVFLSNGPGDPEPCDYAIEAIQELLASGIPIFGICLGHQLLALASGAKTIKMKFGHHGANHPVDDIQNNIVMITSQNHGFAVDEESLPENLTATHRSLFD
jgi:carbamoyl-phosphate synthase small subunit